MSAPAVSVLMTAYNRERYIAEAIESVLASEFGDYELIIVDDGSTDATVEIARMFEARDGRVRVYVNEKNLGDYPNRNRAASLARGRYLKYLDSDDAIYPHGLGYMVRMMEQHPAAALGISRPPSATGPYPQAVTPAEAFREHFLRGGMLTCGPGGCIIRAAAFREVGGFSGKRYVGDEELWLKFAALYPTVKLPQGLNWWRIHYEQEYQCGYRDYSYYHMTYDVRAQALSSPICPLNTEERLQATAHLRWRQARLIVHLAIRRRLPMTAFQVIRKSKMSFLQVCRAFGPSPHITNLSR